MKNVIRIMLTLFAVMVIYLLIYRIFFSDGFRKTGYRANLISLSIAILIGIVLWKKIENISNSLPAFIFGGGILVGTIGFILGFFGPLILTPSSNQGPLLGIFITGPLGFFFGLILGGLYWNMKVKKSRP